MTEACGRPPRSPALTSVVAHLWYVADGSQHGQELKLPTTTAQIIVNLDADRLTTQRLDHRREGALTAGPVAIAPVAPSSVLLDKREQRRTAGIVIRPEAIGAVADVPAQALDLLVGLDQLWGPAADRLAEVAAPATSGHEVLDRIEAELLDLLWGHSAPDTTCRVAIGLLRQGVPVARLAEGIGLSHSALTRRFHAAVGMTPKHYQRLLRLERAIGAATDGAAEWAAVAARCGYSDQAHLVHEFRGFTGLTPKQWRRSARGDAFHIGVDADFLQEAQLIAVQD